MILSYHDEKCRYRDHAHIHINMQNSKYNANLTNAELRTYKLKRQGQHIIAIMRFAAVICKTCIELNWLSSVCFVSC